MRRRVIDKIKIDKSIKIHTMIRNDIHKYTGEPDLCYHRLTIDFNHQDRCIVCGSMLTREKIYNKGLHEDAVLLKIMFYCEKCDIRWEQRLYTDEDTLQINTIPIKTPNYLYKKRETKNQ